MYTMCVPGGQRSKERIRGHGSGITEDCEPSSIDTRNQTGHQRELVFLTSEPSLHPQCLSLKYSP